MAMNIFEYYGIKEVANVYFEALTDEQAGMSDKPYNKGDIVLYLDTLKVSTVETTAENVSAQGGWGNPKLITWDYGKDINVTLEDAVVSFEELRTMLGASLHNAGTDRKVTVRMNAEFKVVDKGGAKELECVKYDDAGKPLVPAIKADTKVKYVDRVNGARGQAEDVAAVMTDLKDAKAGDRVILFWEEERDGTNGKEAVELIISPDTYPGTYRVVGDALIRNKDGKDEAFQFVINKAKMLSEVTLTMQAEGDPSTFNMTLNVLRDDNGDMMSLIKY
jgi:ribosomal protein L14